MVPSSSYIGMPISENIQIVRGHNFAGVTLSNFGEQNVIQLSAYVASAAIAAMIEHKQAGIDLICDRGEFDRRRVILAMEFLEFWSVRVKVSHGIDFVDEHVTAAAVVEECLRGRGVARNHNGAARCVEAEAKGIDHLVM